MAKVTKKQWLDALTKARRFYGRVLHYARTGNWAGALRLEKLDYKRPCLFCTLARRKALSSCRSCPLQTPLLDLCDLATTDFWYAVIKENLGELENVTFLMLREYRKCRRWVREHY